MPGEIGDPHGPNFALPQQFLQSLQRFFNRHTGPTERPRGPMNLVKIDIIRAQVFQGAVAGFNNLVMGQVIGEYLGGNHHPAAVRSQRPAQNGFRVTIAVNFRGVERGDPGIQRGPDSLFGFPVVDADPHLFARLPGSHDDGRDL